MTLKRIHTHPSLSKGKLLRFFFIIALIIGIGSYLVLEYQQRIFGPIVELDGQQSAEFFIPTHSTYEEVTALLELSGYLKDTDDFKWLASKKGYPSQVKAGRYIFKQGMTNNQLVNMLRAGDQTPIRLTFNNIRTKEELAGKISDKIEADSLSLLDALGDSLLLTQMGFSPQTALALFIPNTYELWWNTGATQFLKRMHHEYEQFWNPERREKAKMAGLSLLEVATLASIVDEETIKTDEKPIVAGLYINRLKRGIRLQADPTIKFVLGDFTINRVLSRDLIIDSPYNTYLYAGLPPGPIRMPSVSGINAVLNHQNHDYLYMCAKEDFSGYHNFAKTLNQHNQNAARYRRALREKRIWR